MSIYAAHISSLELLKALYIMLSMDTWSVHSCLISTPGEYAALQPFGIWNLSHTVQSWSFIPEWSEACGEEKSYTKRGLNINVRQRLLQSDTGSPGPFCLYVHKSGLKPDSFNFICKAIRSHHCATSLSRWVLLLPSTSREPTTE